MKKDSNIKVMNQEIPGDGIGENPVGGSLHYIGATLFLIICSILQTVFGRNKMIQHFKVFPQVVNHVIYYVAALIESANHVIRKKIVFPKTTNHVIRKKKVFPKTINHVICKINVFPKTINHVIYSYRKCGNVINHVICILEVLLSFLNQNILSI